ncbi:uncharacterized protein LOC117180159 [Belonocnema kinseyi]|uniref:uncharacterized protein LOC117180159 n=1 Tax=Belonocnema kinseyi TaxID=2817044 RepID=UPI00143D5358|nr:uncharacterized protein LOC117180159 [Belonocnema kinseyi]
MTVMMNLETRQRAFSEWWTEETEYLFQKIERWATCARGYNRLISQRMPKSRMPMEENISSSRSRISGNKLFVEEASWNPRFQTLNRSHASKSQPEELKLNCCGTLNYKSNSKLDSTCLETYSYDHSIYFKTIGDLKTKSTQDLREENQDWQKECLDLKDDFEKVDKEEFKQKIEWEQPRKKERFDQLIFIESFNEEDEEVEYLTRSPVDMSKLSIDEADRNYENLDKYMKDLSSDQNQNQKQNIEFNVNFDDGLKDVNDNFQFDLHFGNPLGQSRSFSDFKCFNDSEDSKYFNSENRNQKEMKRFFSPRRKSKCQVLGDDNVWPGVFLTYRKNTDIATSPHEHAESVRGSDCYFVSGS